MNRLNPVEILGSDNRIYLIEHERTGYDSVELSLIPVKLGVSHHQYDTSNIDMHKDIVERYIYSIKSQYLPEMNKLARIHHMLNRAQINNYFDYMHLLQQINPIFEELLRKK